MYFYFRDYSAYYNSELPDQLKKAQLETEDYQKKILYTLLISKNFGPYPIFLSELKIQKNPVNLAGFPVYWGFKIPDKLATAIEKKFCQPKGAADANCVPSELNDLLRSRVSIDNYCGYIQFGEKNPYQPLSLQQKIVSLEDPIFKKFKDQMEMNEKLYVYCQDTSYAFSEKDDYNAQPGSQELKRRIIDTFAACKLHVRGPLFIDETTFLQTRLIHYPISMIAARPKHGIYLKFEVPAQLIPEFENQLEKHVDVIKNYEVVNLDDEFTDQLIQLDNLVGYGEFNKVSPIAWERSYFDITPEDKKPSKTLSEVEKPIKNAIKLTLLGNNQPEPTEAPKKTHSTACIII